MEAVRVIDDLETLRAIAEPTRAAILEHLASPQSVSKLAATLGVPRTRLYHHVELLRAKGLIEVVAERRVGAMTEQIYAPTAKTFRPSSKLLGSTDPTERLEALSTLLFDATKSDFQRSVITGRASLTSGDGPRRLAAGRSIAFLSADAADAFITELDALVARFDAAHQLDDDAEPFAFSWVCYPASRTIR